MAIRHISCRSLTTAESYEVKELKQQSYTLRTLSTSGQFEVAVILLSY